MNTALVTGSSAAEPHQLRTWALIRAIILALLGLCLTGAVLSAQAPTNNSSLPRPDSLTNESLLRLLSRSNRATIANARAVETTAQNADVRRFAGEIATEHTAILASLQQLWHQLGYTAPDSSEPLPTGNGITGNDTAAVRPSSNSDWSYVDQEIAAHTKLLLTLQQRAPKVGEESLRAFVSNVMQTEERHLREARAVLERQPKPEAAEAGQ